MLKMDATKTNLMVLDPESDAHQVIPQLLAKRLVVLRYFKLLGSIIIVTTASNGSTEVTVSLRLAKKIGRSWGIALYGSESWLVKTCDAKRITAFEFWSWHESVYPVDGE